jgi:hypothetical protein
VKIAGGGFASARQARPILPLKASAAGFRIRAARPDKVHPQQSGADLLTPRLQAMTAIEGYC